MKTVIDRSLNYGRHHIERFLNLAPGCKAIVDLGAGHGDDLLLARKAHADAKLHAVEAYPPYIQELESKNITVHKLNIEKDPLPFGNNSVDAVIVNQILEHVKEIYWIFHEITRVLRPGGSLIIGVPNIAALHNRILLSIGRQPSPLKNNSAHVRGYTKHDLLNFVKCCFPNGYALREFGGANFYPFPPVLAKPLARVLPNMAWGIFLRLERTQVPYAREFIDYPIVNQLETNFYTGPGVSDRATLT
jgi:SAM-dependent methyltransferase